MLREGTGATVVWFCTILLDGPANIVIGFINPSEPKDPDAKQLKRHKKYQSTNRFITALRPDTVAYLKVELLPISLYLLRYKPERQYV